MKRSHKLLCLLLALLTLAALVLPAAAADYTYTVRLYAGNCGTIRGQTVVIYEGLHYGDRVSFRMEDVQITADSKYYVRGFRQSGRDNNTVEAASFTVTCDRDYVVAYGVKGNLVAYTVRYLDADGSELLPEATYYGNVGDKPIVPYLFIENYQPRWYNVTKTLSENAADNLLTFTYDKLPAGAKRSAPDAAPSLQSFVTERPDASPQPDGTAVPPATDAQSPAPVENAPEPTAQPAEEIAAVSEELSSPDAAQTPVPEELHDLDAPRAGSAYIGGDTQTERPPVWIWIAGGILAVALVSAVLLLLRRRRKTGR